jgi:competence protein ComK
LGNKTRTGQYIISFDTFMLEPIIANNKVTTRIIERNGEFVSSSKPLHIVRNSCSFYGGSLGNSTNIAKLAIGNRHKTPVIIAHDFGIPYIFLPTMSPSSELNTWIAHHSIENLEPHKLGCTVRLENGLSIIVNVSANTMYRQLAFATFLEKDFLKKQRQLNRPDSYRNFNDPADD